MKLMSVQASQGNADICVSTDVYRQFISVELCYSLLEHATLENST